jgi:hypothetical protein
VTKVVKLKVWLDFDFLRIYDLCLLSVLESWRTLY